jgi:hypothetical protein
VKPRQQKLQEEVEPEAQVGIFWVIEDNVLLDTTPLSAAEDYFEYDEPPRGRVAYHKTTRKFSLLADKCILRDTNKITDIMSLMHLPSGTLSLLAVLVARGGCRSALTATSRHWSMTLYKRAV